MNTTINIFNRNATEKDQDHLLASNSYDQNIPIPRTGEWIVLPKKDQRPKDANMFQVDMVAYVHKEGYYSSTPEKIYYPPSIDVNIYVTP